MMVQTEHYNVRQSASYAKTLGITQRATPLPFPWTGELRVRFSDFQVNEICKDGSVLHLRQIGLGDHDSTKRPLPAQPADNPEEVEDPRDEKNSGSPNEQSGDVKSREISAQDIAALSSLTNPTFADELVRLFKDSDRSDSERRKSVASGPIDRYNRGQIHQEVRRIFKSKIDTTTDSSDCIVATLAAPMRRGDKRNRGGRNHRRAAPKPKGAEYLHFTLFKDNRDTMDAVAQIARILRVKPQAINYAGTKDRRASTAQRCSVRYIRDTTLAGLNGKLRGITTGDYQYQEEPIHLGELLGNEFAITLKNCEIFGKSGRTADTLSERLNEIRSNAQSALDHMVQHGWINYFGHQRFGTHQIGTHQVGKLILADKFEDAVNSILAFDEEVAQKAETEESPEPAKRDEYARHLACMLFRTGKDVEKAIDSMPRRFTAEGCVMRHLNRQGQQTRRDFVGAVIHITRGLRSMYLHAYQSHVWNHAASWRWELFGENVVKGDLVIADAEVIPALGAQDQDDDIVNPVEDEDDAPVRARPLTEEEASSGQYTIHDIVLPTPGYDVVYPENEIGEFYRNFMGREENGSLDPHKMRRMRREFSLPGRYRKLMHKFLGEPSVEFRVYTNDEEQMHPTDLDVLHQAETRGSQAGKRGRMKFDKDDETEDRENAGEEGSRPSKIQKIDGKTASGNKEGSDAAVNKAEREGNSPIETGRSTTVNQQTKIAAIVKFQLGKSAYATVALRELMGDPLEKKAST